MACTESDGRLMDVRHTLNVDWRWVPTSSLIVAMSFSFKKHPENLGKWAGTIFSIINWNENGDTL